MFLLTLFSGKMEFHFKEKWRTSYNEIVIMKVQCSVIKLHLFLSLEALPLTLSIDFEHGCHRVRLVL